MRMHTEHSLEKFYYSMEETLSRKMDLVKIVLMSGQVKWESTKETGTNIKNEEHSPGELYYGIKETRFGKMDLEKIFVTFCYIFLKKTMTFSID